MRSYSRWFLSLAMFSVVTLITVSSSAKTVNRLADVSFVSASDRIEVRITPSISLKPAQISATIDGSLLVIRAEDSTARRRWVNARDTDIKRVLVAPPKASKTTASIRIRFKIQLVMQWCGTFESVLKVKCSSPPFRERQLSRLSGRRAPRSQPKRLKHRTRRHQLLRSNQTRKQRRSLRRTKRAASLKSRAQCCRSSK